jgi:hypothetical protein
MSTIASRIIIDCVLSILRGACGALLALTVVVGLLWIGETLSEERRPRLPRAAVRPMRERRRPRR